MSNRIVILGAGPTGLGAAHRLGELGYRNWDIFEAADHVGGLASSVADDHGFIWDHGGHVMFSHYEYFDHLVEDILRGDYDEHMREAWIWMQDRFIPYPFQNNIHRLADSMFKECLAGAVRAQQSCLPKENFSEWITAVFGDGIARNFMAPYNWKVWAHPLEMLGTQWQGDRVPRVDTDRILHNLRHDRDDVNWGPNNKFKFPLLGTGMLYERIAASLPQDVHFNKAVVAVDVNKRVVEFADGSRASYDKLITTIPLKELIKCIADCPMSLVEASRTLCHTEGLFIGIGVADECPSSKCWMYFPGPDSPFYRVTYLSNYSPRVVPGPGHFSLLAEVSSSVYKPENVADVVDRTIEGMIACALLEPEQAERRIVSRQLLRVPYSYPVPTRERDEALRVIQPWLMQHGIYSRGRFGAWRYEIGNTDHSVMMGVEVADYLVNRKPETTWALLPGEEARTRIA
jgi:protoporphyrinogen oxidase